VGGFFRGVGKVGAFPFLRQAFQADPGDVAISRMCSLILFSWNPPPPPPQGFVGVVTKPVVGVLDFASNVTEGIRNTTTVFDQATIDKVRLPRFIAADGILRVRLWSAVHGAGGPTTR
jgi:hypothetical protein